MLAEERHSKIKSILSARGFATVEDLAGTLKVSDMTIRRDLEKCQENGVLQRLRGGAVIVGHNQLEASFENKSSENRGVKRAIARAAANLVEEDMAVFIDAGTTCYEIAQIICAIPRVTIVSNDVHTVNSLLHSGAPLICLGGTVQKQTGSIFDHFAEQLLEQMNFDIAFVGAHTISSPMDQGGRFTVMTPTPEKPFFKRRILLHANKSILVVDQSKFHKKALYEINDFTSYDGIITDFNFSPDDSRALRNVGVSIVHI
ncbi:MAG: DeoR/GlpR family DNA-binding transcription regulator [Treponemataceae bacterium]|nr:MAG: DeoR/GlpR family DNA-binding transcription regulator [Treponemataceae bacterium]